MTNLSETANNRPTGKELGTTSFLSQVNSCNSVKNDNAIKTKEEFVIQNNSLNNRFIFGLILFSLVSLGLGIKWLITSQQKLITECASCKIGFLAGFYLFAFSNVILVFIYFRAPLQRKWTHSRAASSLLPKQFWHCTSRKQLCSLESSSQSPSCVLPDWTHFCWTHLS